MDQTKISYYKESGIASPLSIFLVFLCGLPTILILSFAYSLIISFLPIIYFNFLFAIGYGFSISFVTRIFTIIFKLRNRKKTVIINILFAVFAVYVQWVSYLFILSFESLDFSTIFNDFGFYLNILIRPDLVIANIIEISKIGLWSLGTSNINVRGLILWIIWAAEISIILFIAWNNFRQFNILPFSEKDNKWFKKQIIDFDFEHIAFKKNFVENFATKPYESLDQLKKGDGLRHSKITLFISETESKDIISIDNIVVTQRGKGKKDVINVLKLCYVDNIFSRQVRSKYRIKKASILDQ